MESSSHIPIVPPSDRKPITHMTKGKYKKLQVKVTELVTKNAGCVTSDEILDVICDVLKFDPNLSTYDREKVHSKCLESGTTTYQLVMKKYYEENKKTCNARRAEMKRKQVQREKELKELENNMHNLELYVPDV